MIAIVAIVYLAYGRESFIPSIFGDEWGNLNAAVQNSLACLDREGPRALGNCPYFLLLSVFKTNILAYKVFALLAIIATGLLLFLILENFIFGKPIFNFVIVALFLIYPTVWIRSWMYGVLSFILCLYLLGYLSISVYTRREDPGRLLAGIFLILIGLLVYETGVGLTILFSILVYLVARNLEQKKRFALLAPGAMAILYSVWRFFAQQQVGTAYGHGIEEISLSPGILITRLISGYRLNIQWGWTVSLLRLFPDLRSSQSHQSALATVILIVVLASFAFLLSIVSRRIKRLNIQEPDRQGGIAGRMKHFGAIGIIGVLLLGAGYIPVFLVEGPGLAFATSRNNYLPAIGAAITLCAGLMFLLILLGNQGRRAEVNLLWLAAPLILLGMVRQGMVQNETFQGWKEQKAIWQQMFLAAPDYAPGTVVFLRMPHYPDYEGARPFESGTWGFSGALTLLYGHPVQGYFAYPDFGARFTSEGIAHPGGAALIPYSEVVLFTYDRETRRLNLESNLPEELKTFAGPATLCDDCVLDRPASQVKYRALVQ